MRYIVAGAIGTAIAFLVAINGHNSWKEIGQNSITFALFTLGVLILMEIFA